MTVLCTETPMGQRRQQTEGVKAGFSSWLLEASRVWTGWWQGPGFLVLQKLEQRLGGWIKGERASVQELLQRNPAGWGAGFLETCCRGRQELQRAWGPAARW